LYRSANLFVPGKTAEDQKRFMTFVAALTHAVNVHGDALRIGVASAGNDHRLGAQEAPPAIISLYTGELMEAHIRNIIKGGPLDGYTKDSRSLDFGTGAVQAVKAGKEDRNRTAPFPFCGNRFEFRAVGAQQNIAFPLFMLNTAMADSLATLADRIEGGEKAEDAVRNTFKENIRVIFNGNGTYLTFWLQTSVLRACTDVIWLNVFCNAQVTRRSGAPRLISAACGTSRLLPTPSRTWCPRRISTSSPSTAC